MATRQEIVKKYWPHAAALVFLLLFVYTCANNKQHELAGENKKLQEQLREQKDGLIIQEKHRKFIKDSFAAEIKKIAEKENISKDKIARLENDLKSINSGLDKAKEEIKNYTHVQSVKAFNKRYGPASADFDLTSVSLKNDTPKKVLTDLAIKDALEDTLVIKDSVIKEKDEIIEGKQETITMQSIEISEGEKSIELGKNALKASEDLTKNEKDQNKALKTKSTVAKILIPVAFIVGILIGKN